MIIHNVYLKDLKIKLTNIERTQYKKLKKNKLISLLNWDAKNLSPGFGANHKLEYFLLDYSFFQNLEKIKKISPKEILENINLVIIEKEQRTISHIKEKERTITIDKTPSHNLLNLNPIFAPFYGLGSIMAGMDSSNYTERTITETKFIYKKEKPRFSIIKGKSDEVLKEIMDYLIADICKLLPSLEGNPYKKGRIFWKGLGKFRGRSNGDTDYSSRLDKIREENKLEKGLIKYLNYEIKKIAKK